MIGGNEVSVESRLAVTQPGFSTSAVSRVRVYDAAKSAVDFSLALLLLILLLPVFLIIAVAIKLESRGPIFFIQERVGRDGRLFGFVKFRSMENGAHQRHEEVIGEFQEGAAVGVKADPRVTSVGAVLRRWSIDELPQLINVLRGEMSLVGPRPLPLRDYELLDDVQKKRYMVLPGVTGMWQVSGRSDLGFDELIRLDFSYIDQWSIWMDMVILVKTIPVVFGRKGAF